MNLISRVGTVLALSSAPLLAQADILGVSSGCPAWNRPDGQRRAGALLAHARSTDCRAATVMEHKT